MFSDFIVNVSYLLSSLSTSCQLNTLLGALGLAACYNRSITFIVLVPDLLYAGLILKVSEVDVDRKALVTGGGHGHVAKAGEVSEAALLCPLWVEIPG